MVVNDLVRWVDLESFHYDHSDSVSDSHSFSSFLSLVVSIIGSRISFDFKCAWLVKYNCSMQEVNIFLDFFNQ